MAIPTAVTVRKIRKLQRHILAEAKQFDLGIWGFIVNSDRELELKEALDQGQIITDQHGQHVFGNPRLKKAVQSGCGTVGCIAGSICIMQKLITPTYNNDAKIYVFNVHTKTLAKNFLGISTKDANNLFFLPWWLPAGAVGSGWPDEFANRLSQWEPGTQEYAQVAVDRLEHYIQTGR